MANRYYIGLDVGTSGCKAAVVDETGRFRATARRDYGLLFPKRGYVEIDPVRVWQAVKETLKEIAGSGYQAQMLSISSIGEAMVLLDREENVLCNGITYLDERGPETVDQIGKTVGYERTQRITWIPIRMIFSLNRWLWLEKHQPEVIDKTDKAFLMGDYITYLMTGERLIDPSTGSKTLMLNALKRDWDTEMYTPFHIPIDKFSRVVPTGTSAGRIRPALAQELGLSADLEIIIGAHDQSAATLGSGGVFPGDIAAGEGSSESLNLVIGRESLTEDLFRNRFVLEPYIIPDRFLVPVGQHANGTSIRWFLQELGADFGDKLQDGSADIFARAEANCAADAGEVICLPYLTRANLMDPDHRSLGIFAGIELGTTKAQMYRALLEGLCCETRLSLEILHDTGLPVRQIKACGGCARSDLYMQLKADIIGQRISRLENTDAGIIGLAMVCAVSSGEYTDYAQARETFVKISKTWEPQRSYDSLYEKYKKLRAAAKSLYQEI